LPSFERDSGRECYKELERSLLHFYCTAAKTLLINGAGEGNRTLVIMTKWIHWEIRQIAPENRAKRGYSTPLFLPMENSRPSFTTGKRPAFGARHRRSLVEAHFFQQNLEARFGSHGVEIRIDFETPTISILLLITFLQPIQGLVLFAESKMEIHPRPR